MEHKVPIQSLIDHIKSAVDVDPWAQEMAEKLLKKHIEKGPVTDSQLNFRCPDCNAVLDGFGGFCPACGQAIKNNRK